MRHPIILVVDDNTDFLTFIETLLAFAGYTVLACRHSAQVLALVRERQPHLLMLDIRMEHEHSGLEVLAQLRSIPETAAVPVLLCSADVETLHVYAAANHEPHTGVLAKPFEIDALLAMLKQLECQIYP